MSLSKQRQADLKARCLRLLDAPAAPIERTAYAWDPVWPGVSRHVVDRYEDGSPRSALVIVEANTAVPEHEHIVPEDVFVIEGTLEFFGDGEGSHPAGAVVHSPAGSRHSAAASAENDCVCYVSYLRPGSP